MQDFESIRPYHDDEVHGVARRLADQPEIIHGVALFAFPRVYAFAPRVAAGLARALLLLRARQLHSVGDVQLMMSRYIEIMLRNSVEKLEITGIDQLPSGKPYLFMSNHRDIVLDPMLLNYAIHHAGHRTCRMAVGDNLFTKGYTSDLMRLNKSFVVERSVSGTKAVYAALLRTSNYIRTSLNEGESVWIAQREGRAKDGFDRTDPALLKMLALAHRKEIEQIGDLFARIDLVPVSISYELDPCDVRKAQELFATERDGHYDKAPDDDLQSMIEGLTAPKGRVSLHFGQPLKVAASATPEEIALAIDRAIVGGCRVFPTHKAAAQQLGIPNVDEASIDGARTEGALAPIEAVQRLFDERLNQLGAGEREYLLTQYANLIRNRNELACA